MRFLRGTILAIGLMSFAVACGGSKKEAAEPMPAAETEPAGDMGGETGGEEANPCAGTEGGAEGAEGGADPCAGGE
jgi:hypothetical protein